jgi:protein-S-isoprenylcysteine O-methyltransferase Ste14
MAALELKVPPPVVALLAGAAMWAVSRVTPAIAAGGLAGTIVAAIIALIGVGIGASGAIAIRRAKTTISPLKPETASSLVTNSIYRITRNPMYLGLLVMLMGWAIYLLNVWAMLGPVIFAVFITRFQIKPEERILSSLFGKEYAEYSSKVRRWL